MSGPQGPDPTQPWQPPGEGGDQQSGEKQTQVGSPWQQQPAQEADAGRPRRTRRLPSTRSTNAR